MSLVNQITAAESGGNPNATNPLSSASGPDQFINSTWLSVLKAHRPDIAAGKTDAQLLALKNDPSLSAQMTAAYASDNAGLLRHAGLPVTPGTEYLAHFAGPQGAIGILNADPNASAASVLGQGFAKANPTLAGYTAGQLASWANRKMSGSGSPAPMSIAGPQTGQGSAQPSPAPTQGTPQNNAQAPAAANSPASAPVLSPYQIAQIAATPAIQNILPPRPNYFGQTAPFSLGG